MSKVIIYTRVSTEEQAKTGMSLSHQEKACIDFAERSGYEVVNIFREQGVSAKSTNRKKLLEMLDYCKVNRGKVDYVIVWKVDRFARNTRDHLALRTTLLKCGVKLLSVTEPIEDGHIGRLMETMLAAIAEFDNDVRGERSINGLRARAEQGGWITYAPLGYKNVKDSAGRPTLEVIPELAAKIVTLFKEYVKGTYTQKELAEFAYQIGLRSRQSGERLSVQTIANILNNVAYIGRRIDKATGQAVRALHKPIVSEELFNDAQLVLKGRHKELRNDKDEDWPLRAGFMSCADCGTPLTGSKPTGRGGKRYPKYSCLNCRSSVTGKAVSAGRDTVHDEFAELLRSIRPENSHIELFRTVMLRRWNEEYKQLAMDKVKAEKEIAALQVRRQRALDLFVDGKITYEDKEEQLIKIDNERVAIRLHRSELEQEVDDKEIIIDVAVDFMQNVSRYWQVAPLELQRRFQNLVFPDGIAYEFGKGFRTAKLGESYEVIQQIAVKKPSVVGVAGLEPATKGL